MTDCQVMHVPPDESGCYNDPMPNRVLKSEAYFQPGRVPLTIVVANHGHQEVTPHAHEFIELVYFARGTTLHQYADQEYALEPGDLFIIHEGEPHAYREGKNVKLYNVIFRFEAFQPDLEYLQRTDGFLDLLVVEPFFRSEAGLRDRLHLNPAAQVRVEALLEDMRHELTAKPNGWEASARAMLIQLLVFAARCRARSVSGEAGPGTDAGETGDDPLAEKRALIRDCIRFIEEHYADQIRLENLAERAYLSPEYFSRVFKKLTSQSPIEFINAMRIAKAKELLAHSALSVTDIATKTGFSDSSYFARQFKKLEGVSPVQYREQA